MYEGATQRNTSLASMKWKVGCTVHTECKTQTPRSLDDSWDRFVNCIAWECTRGLFDVPRDLVTRIWNREITTKYGACWMWWEMLHYIAQISRSKESWESRFFARPVVDNSSRVVTVRKLKYYLVCSPHLQTSGILPLTVSWLRN